MEEETGKISPGVFSRHVYWFCDGSDSNDGNDSKIYNLFLKEKNFFICYCFISNFFNFLKSEKNKKFKKTRKSKAKKC